MKKIILLFFISTSIYSQKYLDNLYNFKIEKNKLVWQKVFNIKTTKKSFVKQTITNLKYENLQELDNTISFSVYNDIIDFKKYGGKAMFTTFHVQEPKEYLVVIDFKEDKYRVTIKQITVDYVNSLKTKAPLDELIIKNNKIKNSKRNRKDLMYYQKHFIEKFTITETKKEDW